jgi:hypothetical protein
MDLGFADDHVDFCRSAGYQRNGLVGGVEHRISPYATGNGERGAGVLRYLELEAGSEHVSRAPCPGMYLLPAIIPMPGSVVLQMATSVVASTQFSQ